MLARERNKYKTQLDGAHYYHYLRVFLFCFFLVIFIFYCTASAFTDIFTYTQLSTIYIYESLECTDGGGLQFFSFCMNQFVNPDRVVHCINCGKCYHRRVPGVSLTCGHCGYDAVSKQSIDQSLGGRVSEGYRQESNSNSYWKR
jgi:hypothetical protein